MRTQRFLIILAGALFCAENLLAAQRTFVSAANGNDANPCSRSLPCRNFAAALPQTDPDGEVIVLDSGGYGAVTITQSISLISPGGVHAGITSFSGTAVTVSAGDAAHVVLRNLSISSQGADYGVNTATVAALYVENCVVSGFAYGIAFFPTTSGARLYVSETIVRRSVNFGIYISGGLAAGLRTTIDSVQLHRNDIGFEIYNAEATIRESVASGSASLGFLVGSSSRVMIEDSVSTGNGGGFDAILGGVMTLTRCTAASNNYGVNADVNGSTVYVSDSTITANNTGIPTAGTVTSRGNNTLRANAADGAFTAIFSAH